MNLLQIACAKSSIDVNMKKLGKQLGEKNELDADAPISLGKSSKTIINSKKAKILLRQT